ncbi:Protein of unknown function [Micrococcales bacterium KH10]|nr:Protein of unknown function [Micrococcales bacterium KH10]
MAVIAFCVLVGLGLGERPADILELLAAFIPALALAWVASRAWRNPAIVKPTGLGIWAATAMVGLAVIALINNARPTMTMATLTVALLGILLLGWRGLVTLMNRNVTTGQ